MEQCGDVDSSRVRSEREGDEAVSVRQMMISGVALRDGRDLLAASALRVCVDDGEYE